MLVDVRKPSIDGYRVCASLKNDPTTRAIPLIFISSIYRSINQAKALLSGAVDYVTDPFDAEEVLWRIETHISLRRLRENLTSSACNRGAQPVPPNEHLERAFQEIRVLTQVTGRKHAEEKARQAARELERREAKIRRLVEANVVGIVMWNLEGAITGANEAFLRMVQYDREDLASGRVRWTDLTPAEWRDRDERAVADLKATGIFQPFEKEYFRKDGSRVPVLLGGALFEGRMRVSLSCSI